MSPPIRLALALLLASLLPDLLMAAGSSGGESDAGPIQRADVSVDMTDAGKALPHPTQEHPTYYFPLPVGCKNEGDFVRVFQRPPPPDAQVEHAIAMALARQGYLVADRSHPPTIVLMFWWGYYAPNRANQANGEMSEVVRGDHGPEPLMTIREQDVIDAARVPRWYLRISALDFDDWRHHKITGLWKEYVSTDLWGHYMDEVLPQLIKTGEPYFGRETKPHVIQEPTVPAGSVEVGKPVFKGAVP